MTDEAQTPQTSEKGENFWDPLKGGIVPKKVDEDWKRKAREESRKLVSSEPRPASAAAGDKPTTAGKPSPHFIEFLTEIATQAALHLQGRHIEQARYTIEILEALREKTKGNLADEEQKLMDRYLYELQMQYVQVVKGAAGKRVSPGGA